MWKYGGNLGWTQLMATNLHNALDHIYWPGLLIDFIRAVAELREKWYESLRNVEVGPLHSVTYMCI